MRTTHTRRLLVAAALALAASACAVDLGTHDDAPTTNSRAYGINDGGTIVGASGNRAFIQRPGGDMELLALPSLPAPPPGLDPGSVVTSARAINAGGTIIGQGYFQSPTVPAGYFGIVWQPDGTARAVEGVLLDINDRGLIIGNELSIRPSGSATTRPFAIAPDGARTHLAPSGLYQVLAVNDHDQIVGNTAEEGKPITATFWDSPPAGAPVALNAGNSNASDINDAGDIVGNDGGTAVVWRGSAHGREGLGAPPFGSASPVGIADDGTIVGNMADRAQRRPFIWSAGDGYRELGTLGGFYAEVNDINASGVAVGWSELSTSVGRGAIVHAVRYEE